MRKAVSWGKSPAKRTKQPKTVSGRNLLHEQTLCKAINGRNVVELRYEIEVLYRTYEPHAVYNATTGNVLVWGLQTKNPLKPFEKPMPRNFTVGEIADVRITSARIDSNATINKMEERFSKGIICSI